MSSALRNMSTVSLISQTSSQRDVNILTHCLNRHKESFETACDKILEHWLSIKRSARPSVGPDADLHSSNSSTMTSSPGSRRLEDEARTFLAQRLVSLLSSMILPNIPHTISAVDARLCGTLVELPERLLPSETELETARVMAEKNRKKGLHLPVDKIFSAVREFNGRFNYSVCIYIAAVAEKIITKWLDLAIRFEEKAQIENVIRASAFQNIFFICRDRVKAPKESAMRRISQFFPQDYDRCVDELINLVSSSVEQLNLILRIFREPLLPLIGDHQTATTVEVKVAAEADESDLSVAAEVFGGIVDFYHNFRFLLDCLETDSVEDYSSATGRTQATTTSPRGLNTTPTSPMRPPSAQSYFSSFSAFHSSWPAPEHRRTQQPFSASSSFSLSSVATGSSNFSTTVNCMNDGQSQCSGVCSRQSRLVGPLLSGPAEDICLGPFMQYLDTVLDLDCFSVLWSLSDRSEVIEALGRLSRTVIHTVSKLKPTYVAATSTNNSVGPELGPDPSWLFLHSFLCPVCRLLEQPGAPKSPTGSSDWNLINDQNPGQRQEPGTSSLQIPRPACNFLVNCFRYLLPRLVLLPIFQFYCLCGIVWALRENTQDQDDKDFLTDFRGMLTKIRVRLESDLSRRTGLHLQLARLISTGHVASVPRSVNVPPPPPASYLRVRSSSTSPLLGTLTTGQSRATSNTTSADCSATPLLGGTCLSDISHIFRAACTTVVGEGSLLAMSPTTTSATTSDNRETQTGTASSLLGGAVLAMGLAKVEEIERLTGGKERLAGSLTLGNFVMEGRLLVREESMKNASERHVYLFTNCMLVCKRTEKRSALAPSSAPPALRIKRRLPLDLIHVIDCTNPIPPSPQAYTFCDAPPESGYYSSSDSSHQNLSRTQGGLSWAASSRSSSTAHLNPAAEHNSFSVEFVEVRHVPSSSTSSAAQTLSAGANAVASTLEPGAATSPSGGFSDTGGCSLTPGSTLTGPVEAAVEPSLPPGANIQRIWFEASSPEEKADWMASLISIQTSRIFDLYLRTLPKLEIPLRLPTPDKYKFTRPDTPNVIVFEHPSLTPSVRSPNPGNSQPNCTDDLLEDDFADLGLTDEEDMFALPDELLQETEQLAPSGSSISDETASTVTDTSLSPTPLPTAAAAATARAPTPLSSSTGATVALSPSYSASRPAIPQIRFATVEKLVERLTYPTYFDAAGVNAFLLSYRRYLTPDQLLTLLIERFNVPDPTFEPQEFEVDRLRGKLESPAGHMLRRFRSGYKFRVQSRVMMFLSRWVRSPRLFEIDFAPNHELCARLTEFLSEVTTCHLLHTARAIEQWISHADIPPYPYVDVSPSVSGETLRPPDEPGRLSTGGHLHESPANSSPASPISLVPRLGALFEGPDHIDLLQIHPTELAEQVTLHEWDLYRRINFLEVVSGEDTPEKAPNLHASKDFSNKFHRWLVYSILSERNAEDRTLAIQRVLDLMLIFEHFQNQQGFQEAKASLVSSGVFRLKKSFQTIRRNRNYREVVDRVQSTGSSRKSRRTPSATGLLGVLHVSSSSSGSSGGCSSSSKLIAFPVSGPAAAEGGEDSVRGMTGSTQLASRSCSHLDPGTNAGSHGQRRQPGRRNPPNPNPQQHCSSPGVPFFALNIITRLIHLELHFPDRVSPDGETLVNFAKCRSRCDIVEKFLCHQRHPYPFTPDSHIQQSLSRLHPFALPEISSTEDFEHRMFKLSKSYEPGESGVPPAAVERRLSKEAIQAANNLANQPIAQKLTPASVRAFKVLCGQVPCHSGTATSSKLDRTSPRVSSPIHGTLTTSPPGEPSSPVSVVNSLWQTRLAQHRENQAHGQKCQSPASARPASSPTVSVVHQHSQSDSQVQKYSSSTEDRFSCPLLVDKRLDDDRSASLPIGACEALCTDTLPNRSYGTQRRTNSPSQRPPPLPPRRRSATRSTPVSQSPTPFCVQETLAPTRVPVTTPLEGEDDADLPPLPPKSVGASAAFQRVCPAAREQTTSSPVSPLFSNPTRQAEIFASQQLLFAGDSTIDSRPPPLPPRRHVSGPAASNVLLQPLKPTVRLP